MELLLGCGHRRQKQLHLLGRQDWDNLVTVDINPKADPDYILDLNNLPYPFEDNTFDEIHAYEVLEHIGKQGDYKFFFSQFQEFYRILKPEGHLFFTCPSYRSTWAWGDPGHTRVITAGSLSFLDQEAVKGNIGRTAMTDYSEFYTGNFKRMYINETDEFLHAILKKVCSDAKET